MGESVKLRRHRGFQALWLALPPWHIVWMALPPPTPFPPPQPLSGDEFAALKKLNKGLLSERISDEHAAKLIKLGYAKEGLGGIGITDLGKIRIAQGNK